MRLKYKKMLLLLTMGIFGVGMVTFSFQNFDHSDIPASLIENSSDDQNAGVLNLTSNPNEATHTPTPTITPVPDDPDKLREVDSPEIIALINKFLDAKLGPDMTVIQECVTDATVINLERLQRKLEYVDGYDNIRCYSKPGINEIDLVLYVVSDYRISTIHTGAPAIDEYCVTYRDGKPYLYYGAISEETLLYVKSLRESEDVISLTTEVEIALENARAKDADLNEFYQNLINQIPSSEPTPSGSSTASSDAEN